jgi:Tol biopolymer transport system component
MSLYVLGLNTEGLAEGSPRRLTWEPGGAWNPLWTADGREVLYLSLRDGALGLWRTPVSGGGAARPVTSIGPIGRHLAVSHRDNRLIYSTLSLDEDIWAVQTRAGGAPVRLIASSLTDSAPQTSPDGAKIAVISDRSGQAAVWVADADGRNAAKLVDAPGMSAAPWWSPDGLEIAYECSLGESSNICVIPANGGKSRRVTGDAGRCLYPSWSRDGRFIYFSSDRGGDFQVWKAPAAGESAAVQVTRSGGFAGFESPDGRYVYYTKTPQSGQVWWTPVGGGDERTVAGMVRSLRRPQNFAVGAGGIYYAVSDDPRARFQILFRRFDSDEPVTLARVERALGNGMSLTPDGRTLLFSAYESRGGDLMLVENFR